MEKRIEQLKIVLHILEEVQNDLPENKRNIYEIELIKELIEQVINKLYNEL